MSLRKLKGHTNRNNIIISFICTTRILIDSNWHVLRLQDLRPTSVIIELEVKGILLTKHIIISLIGLPISVHFNINRHEYIK